ncbi:MAG: hypothetical protein M1825_002032 [Sarcosagium campestre]|nr:MAG: hypothetical protein M1825_002032 [Sarcosagium campestre]
MGDFKLSASLEGHTDDVRGVSFPSPTVLLSASRDATVRVWKLVSSPPPTFDDTISSHGQSFINAVAFVAPTTDYPDGLIVSGGKDTIIEVRQPHKKPEDAAEALLLGHSHNVCSLDVDPTGQWIVSGGWDGQARLWKTGKWETEAVLEGHGGSVWAVLAWDEKTIITGCADQFIRIFDVTGRLLQTIEGNKDVIRALCRVPAGHPSGAQFASASNDGIIRLWTLQGRQVGELHGHDSFIYALGSLPSGELISSGEDRTLRIWKGTECIQTITHPAISVWSVASCAETGDIVSGASDRIVRVFSRSNDRIAKEEVIRAFDDSVKSSAIPQQQIGDVNKDKLPGPEFLQTKSGTKEGQVAMIRESNGNVTAHTWSVSKQQWDNVGTVVDAAGSSGRKKGYLGTDYDYVFDVDVEEGKPPLKLPYNLSENPYEAATRFITDNELPMTYLDQVADFITSNTQGASISQTQSSGPDAWGTESRYRPGDDSNAATASPSLPTARPKVLPQTSYLPIKTANLKTIHKKIQELNQQLIKSGDKELSLNPTDLSSVENLTTFLEQPADVASKPSVALLRGVELIVRLATTWPPADRLPALDLLRLLAAASPAIALYRSTPDTSIVDALEQSGVFNDPDRPNNAMLAVRTFANLFETAEGRSLAATNFEKVFFTPSSNSSISYQPSHTSTDIHALLLHDGYNPANNTNLIQIQSLTSSLAKSTNRNLLTSYTTLLINYSVQLTLSSSSSSSTSESASKPPPPPSSAATATATAATEIETVTEKNEVTDEAAQDRALSLLAPLTSVLETAGDSEVIYRALVATGTLLTLNDDGDEVRNVARDVYSAAALCSGVEARFKEPRVKGVCAEVKALLGKGLD